MIDDELRVEKMEEYARDAKIEQSLETDLDYFLEYYEDDISELQEAYNKVKDLLKLHGWDYSDYFIKEELL